MGRINNRAQFFTIDALVALTVILMTIIVISPVIKDKSHQSTISSDVLISLDSISMSEFDNEYAQQLISNGQVSNPSRSVLEQIGEFYVTDIDTAKNLAAEALSSISPKENIGIWYGSTLIASQNITPFESAEDISTDRQTISGIGGNGTGVTGFSTRAFLSSSSRTNHVYFGGYVGEGNITSYIEYEGTITSADIELVVNEDFELLINDVSQGTFSGSPDDFTPVSYSLPTSDFSSGTNTLEIKGDSLHVTGGFAKVKYASNVTYEQPTRYKFPGIKGIINLYDGFYVPGNLTGLTISMRFNNSIDTFLTIGKTQIFNSTSTGTSSITIPNSTLASILNYSDLSKKTVPIRFGMEDMHYYSNGTTEIDVFSITSVSGQMQGKNAIDTLREGNYEFVDIVLENSTNNRVGLVGYEFYAKDEDYHELSTNQSSLNETIEGWKAGSSTCTCCGVNRAVSDLVNDSNSSAIRSIVVMSAGPANTKCDEQGTGDPEDDAIKAVCDAYNDHGIQVYTIGFGEDANIETLTEMASCADGSFYSAVDDLRDVYEEIAQEILRTSYSEQTVEVSGNLLSELFPDSYIEFEYEEDPNPFGILTTIEEQFSTPGTATFSIPQNSELVEATAISYSGPKWTSLVEINNQSIYNLSQYETDFLELGDPYSISIPVSKTSQNNSVNLETALSPENATGGSIYNKIIYTISKELASYTSVSATADGCNWTVQFNSYNLTLPIPANYTGSDNCEYSSDSYCGIYSDCQGATDSVQIAVYNILKILDFDLDGKVDADLSSEDLEISTSNLEGVPFLFSTEVQVRQWR